MTVNDLITMLQEFSGEDEVFIEVESSSEDSYWIDAHPYYVKRRHRLGEDPRFSTNEYVPSGVYIVSACPELQ